MAIRILPNCLHSKLEQHHFTAQPALFIVHSDSIYPVPHTPPGKSEHRNGGSPEFLHLLAPNVADGNSVYGSAGHVYLYHVGRSMYNKIQSDGLKQIGRGG